MKPNFNLAALLSLGFRFRCWRLGWGLLDVVGISGSLFPLAPLQGLHVCQACPRMPSPLKPISVRPKQGYGSCLRQGSFIRGSIAMREAHLVQKHGIGDCISSMTLYASWERFLCCCLRLLNLLTQPKSGQPWTLNPQPHSGHM